MDFDTTMTTGLKIGLDFDDTVSADLDGWSAVVCLMKGIGWDVRITTFRHETGVSDNEDVLTFAKEAGIPVIFTNGKQKRHHTKDIGWVPDIWIDDSPHYIPSVHQMTWMLKSCINEGDVGDYAEEKRETEEFKSLED
ncbi:putative 5'-nucleotidase [Salmonella phage pSal-SNUABM-01]|nr:putative 5'-nucleotidase [Salmonella phage pSal-SNUABM-01]